MFKTLETLDTVKHADLTYEGYPGYAFARNLVHSPLAGDEVAEAAKTFPIVFPAEGKLLPVALLSLKKDACAYVGADDSWLVDFIPSHIRRYPFMLGNEGNSDKFVLMIDRAAPQFAQVDGEPLFDDGKPTEKGIVNTALEYLREFHLRLARTEKLLAPLEENNLLVPRRFEINAGGKKTIAVERFRQVDQEALLKLDDAVLGSWVRSGLMSVIVAHFHSMNNVDRLYRLQNAA